MTLRELAQAALDAMSSPYWPRVAALVALQDALEPPTVLALLDQLDAAQEALRLADAALGVVRRYVAMCRDDWNDGATPLEAAYFDIYQKVLNVIDTGDPMAAARARQEEP